MNKYEAVFDTIGFLKEFAGATHREYPVDAVVFAQGEPAESVCYVVGGSVKIKVNARNGKEAVVAMLSKHSFFGEGCLTNQPLRMSTAVVISPVSLICVDKKIMARLLHDHPAFSETFLRHVLSRNARIEEDLVDQLFNSSEKRLARVLLLLANYGSEGIQKQKIPKISQETLASIVGTTRSRISFFMNRFRDLGFITYNGDIEVHSSLLNIVLHD
jgi:CRP/FNR family transcriptional regulator, cyclic AMP receptor protein